MARINFFLPHLRVSGGVRIALQYASNLAQRGHSVTVYVQSQRPIRRMIANYLHLGYPRWIQGFAARVMRVVAFRAEYIADADVNIATSCQSMILLESLPASKGRQFHLIQHDEGLYHVDRKLADRAFTSSARKIVVSTWLKDILRDTYGQESDLLINPVDTKQFCQFPRTADTQTIRVLLLHHTYDWKGTAEGTAVVRAVQARHPNVRLILFGVRQKDDIEIAYDEYHYNVPQNKLAELYSNTDIYLCSSWDEGYGLPSVEAMACGAALVTYDNGGSRDYAFHEKTALVAKRRDTDDLELQLERMVSDVELRHRIAKTGQRFVLSMPNWGVQTKELERILRV